MDTQEISAAQNEDLIAALDQRISTYALLSRLYLKEIDEALLAEMHEMLYPVEAGNNAMNEGYLLIATYLSNLWSESLHELRIDFTKIFLGDGIDAFSAAYPYESVYTSEKRLMMGEARAEVLAIYRSFGIVRDETWHEGEDHIALELDFMRVLCQRACEALAQGNEDEATHLLEAQQKFLDEHMLNWVPMMTSDIKRFAQTKMYKGLAFLTEGFLTTDAEFLDELLVDDVDKDKKSDGEGEADCVGEESLVQ